MLIPLVGNIAEHIVAVQVAVQDKMDLSLGIAIGSGLQIALFVTPVLVGISILIGHPMTLVFSSYELAALIGAALIAVLISVDGESNWLEGAQLLALYTVLGSRSFLPEKELLMGQSGDVLRNFEERGITQRGSFSALFGPT